MRRILVATMSILLISFILTWPSPSGAEKVHTVKLTKGQVIVEKERPNEFTAYMLSESGSGGILVTPSENPSFGKKGASRNRLPRGYKIRDRAKSNL